MKDKKTNITAFYNGVLAFHMLQSPHIPVKYKSPEERAADNWKAVEKSFISTGNSIEKAVKDFENGR